MAVAQTVWAKETGPHSRLVKAPPYLQLEEHALADTLPAGQTLHTALPAPEKVPSGQHAQVAPVGCAMVPARQGVQVPLPRSLTVPVGHGNLALATQKLPAGQATQKQMAGSK
jgi:hypothetical protein